MSNFLFYVTCLRKLKAINCNFSILTWAAGLPSDFSVNWWKQTVHTVQMNIIVISLSSSQFGCFLSTCVRLHFAAPVPPCFVIGQRMKFDETIVTCFVSVYYSLPDFWLRWMLVLHTSGRAWPYELCSLEVWLVMLFDELATFYTKYLDTFWPSWTPLLKSFYIFFILPESRLSINTGRYVWNVFGRLWVSICHCFES